jgi:L-ascorbate metabolism protein UlaG (beta-lactamase superfamily)
MKFTKYGHACQLVEEGDARILIDPGGLSSGFEEQVGITAVLLTHQHSDHLNLKHLAALLQKNPDMKIHGDEGTVAKVESETGLEVLPAYAGETFDVAGVSVKVVGTDHAVIHPTIPGIPNVGYLIGEHLFYPGDNFILPGVPVSVLAVPTCAPWMKVSEAIDYMLAVGPEIVIPVHDGLLALPDTYYTHLRRFAEPAGMEFRVVANGTTTDV